MFCLWQLELYLSSPILVQFWRAVIESILASFITVCFLRSKTRIVWVNGSSEITGCHLSSVEVLYTMRASNKAQKITSDLSHPGHPLFYLPADDGSPYVQELPVIRHVQKGGFGGSSPCPFSKLFKSAPLRQIAMILWSIKQNAFEF